MAEEPTLRLGAQGDAVRRLQQALAQQGFDPGPADGRFGSQTHRAVQAFQRARGLTADGVVGARTWEALGQQVPEGPQEPATPGIPAAPAGQSRGLSVHIGLNRVDPAHYQGWDGKLKACEADALDMKAIADARGFQSRIIPTASATAETVKAAIANAARSLRPDDILVVTYSGHGGQVRDEQGEEADAFDETWVLYDRQVLDDELAALWALAPAGARIFVLSDSCHSGTVLRVVQRECYDVLAPSQALPEGTRAALDPREAGIPLPAPGPMAAARGLETTLQLAEPMLADLVATFTRAGLEPSAIVAGLVRYSVEAGATRAGPPGEGERPAGALVTKELPTYPRDVQDETYRANRDLYQRIQAEYRGRDVPIKACVLLISGCLDNQLSLDGTDNGLFTQQLLKVWADGAFTGSHQELHRKVLDLMPPYQTPNYYLVGQPNAAFEQQTPWTIQSPRGGPAAAS
jgi:metacaspase-1